MKKIKTVCVIGSGVMGSAIAAQVANSKTNVILLDIASNSGNKNKIVMEAYDKLFTTKPSPLSHPNYAKYIKLGNLEDDISLIKNVDLVIEAIVEKLEIKHHLYESIAQYIKPGTIVASNTSTIALSKLKEKLLPNIRENFIITHFFNPPRYMELLEFVSDEETRRDTIINISDFITNSLGKTIVKCNDTPGFIANRVGCFLLEMVVRKAVNQNLDPCAIDNIFSNYLGFPKTGIFGLYDLIGHDVMGLISSSLLNALHKDDKYHDIYSKCHPLDVMAKNNLMGRKTGAGFYKISKGTNKNTIKQVINFSEFTYQEAKFPDDYNDIYDVLERGDVYSKFINNILIEFFEYVISLVPSVTSDTNDIDKAMKLGYSLKYGPFELLSKMPNGGEFWLKSNGLNIKIPDQIQKNNIITSKKTILDNDSAELQLIDNNYVFVIKSKMNVLDKNVFDLMIESINYCEHVKHAMYILPIGNNFSVGADLRYFKNFIENKNFKSIEEFLILGQNAMIALKYAKIPVVACAKGFALGGGCEILLHLNHVVAHQNLISGLPELGIGLIPAFGGTKEMFMRSSGNKNKLLKKLKNIITQNKSSSVDYFNEDYGTNFVINMNRDLILQEAFGLKIDQTMQAGVINSIEFDIDINLINEFNLENFGELQIDVIKFFQKIIDKKSITEENLLEFEREKFLELAFKPITLEKICKFI